MGSKVKYLPRGASVASPAAAAGRGMSGLGTFIPANATGDGGVSVSLEASHQDGEEGRWSFSPPFAIITKASLTLGCLGKNHPIKVIETWC